MHAYIVWHRCNPNMAPCDSGKCALLCCPLQVFEQFTEEFGEEAS